MSRQIHEECGIVGVLAPGAPQKALSALLALQHRGQEGWGIATDKQVCKKAGLIQDSVQVNPSGAAIGHNRYSTTGGSKVCNLQPILKNRTAYAHNGNIVGNQLLKQACLKKGAAFETETDSETLLNLILLSDKASFLDRIAHGLKDVCGAFALVIIHDGKLYAVRDPWGIRPLALGKLKDGWIVASETIAIDKIGGENIRSVNPGEILELTLDSINSSSLLNPPKPSFCVFEYIYLSSKLSRLEGAVVEKARFSMGRTLANEDKNPQGDIVSFVPETSSTAAAGFASVRKLPLVETITKAVNIRTFIQPSQRERLEALKAKHRINGEVVAGKDISLVDDSLVRGNTAMVVIKSLRKAGAGKIHLKIASPPIVSPCFYGIDIPNKGELLAWKMDERRMLKFLGADSITYLSVEGTSQAVNNSKICNACMTGSYPINSANMSL